MGTETAVSLFSSITDLLQSLYFTRYFKEYRSIYQLKLDILRLRISRWGEIAGLDAKENEKNPSEPEPVDPDKKKLLKLLEGLKELLEHKAEMFRNLIEGEAEKSTSNTKATEPDQPENNEETEKSTPNAKMTGLDHPKKTNGIRPPEAMNQEEGLSGPMKRIRRRFTDVFETRARAYGASISQTSTAVKWAFLDKSHLGDFFDEIFDLAEKIEQAIAKDKSDLRVQVQRLCKDECAGIEMGDLKKFMEMIKDCKPDCDPWLEVFIAEILKEQQTQGQSINQSHNSGHIVGIHHGDNKGSIYGNPRCLYNNTY